MKQFNLISISHSTLRYQAVFPPSCNPSAIG